MIVEDNVKMREAITGIIKFKIRGITEIKECSSGEEAIEQYDNFIPDWVLINNKLNKLDGLTAAEKIYEKDLTAKIIMISECDKMEYKNEADRLGINSCVNINRLDEIAAILNEKALQF